MSGVNKSRWHQLWLRQLTHDQAAEDWIAGLGTVGVGTLEVLCAR